MKIYVNSAEKAEIKAQADASNLDLQQYARLTLMFAELPRPVPEINLEAWQSALSLIDELRQIQTALPRNEDAGKHLETLLETLLTAVTRLRLSLLGVQE